MASISMLEFMDEVLDFLASTPTPQNIIDYQPSKALAERSHYLHDRNRHDGLTDAERGEFEELRRLDHFMNQLKIRARLKRISSTYISLELRQFVCGRVSGCCEYCLIHCSSCHDHLSLGTVGLDHQGTRPQLNTPAAILAESSWHTQHHRFVK